MPGMTMRRLGADDLRVGAIGLGCMPMSSLYGDADPAQAGEALDAAVDAGATLWDTANVYGAGENERLLRPWLARHRGRVAVATKFGFAPDGSVSATPADARRELDASLGRLGVERIDLWYLHRVDPQVPVEETVGAMSEAVAAGKVCHLGLSEASAASLRRACAVHPIAALQSEWSLWTRELEREVLPVARELGIGIVPYCPLGRGMLTGTLRALDDLGAEDYRRSSPRFADAAFAENLRQLSGFLDLAREHGCTPAQLALAWLLAQGDDVVPIPGTRTASHVRENCAAAAITLTPEQAEAVAASVPTPVGARYARPHVYGDSPDAS